MKPNTLLLLATLSASGGAPAANAVNCLDYMASDREFRTAVGAYRESVDTVHPSAPDDVLRMLQFVAAMLDRGMSREMIAANTGLPFPKVDQFISMAMDCGAQPASCHLPLWLEISKIVAWLLEVEPEDAQAAAADAADVLRLAHVEGRKRYIGAYSKPAPDRVRDVGEHDPELVFKLARAEREQCPNVVADQ